MRYTHGYLSKIDGVGENVQLNDGSIDIGDIGFDNEEAKHVDIADPAQWLANPEPSVKPIHTQTSDYSKFLSVDDSLENSQTKAESVYNPEILEVCKQGNIDELKDAVDKHNIDQIMILKGLSEDITFFEFMNTKDWNALCISTFNNNIEIVKYLIEDQSVNYMKYGKLPEVQNIKWFNNSRGEIFLLACAIHNRNKEMFTYFLEIKSFLWRWQHIVETILCTVDMGDRDEFVRLLIQSSLAISLFKALEDKSAALEELSDEESIIPYL